MVFCQHQQKNTREPFVQTKSNLIIEKRDKHKKMSFLSKVEKMTDFIFGCSVPKKKEKKQEVGVNRLPRFPQTERESLREVFFVNSVRALCWISVI